MSIDNPFRESVDGKWSSSRLMGAGVTIAVTVVMLTAAFSAEWETARMLGLELLVLAGALYGINKWAANNTAKESK